MISDALPRQVRRRPRANACFSFRAWPAGSAAAKSLPTAVLHIGDRHAPLRHLGDQIGDYGVVPPRARVGFDRRPVPHRGERKFGDLA